MRTKTEVRRQAIVDTAAAVFAETGFERASMAQICERLGYSKATLYSYFVSKEELFFEVVLQATETEFQALLQALDPAIADLREALLRYGRGLLGLLYSPQVSAMRRLIASEAGRSGIGARCWELGPARGEAALAAFLQHAMERGALRAADPAVAALHLKGLLEAEWIERFIFQRVDTPDADQLAATTERAVDVFLAAYGPVRRSEG